MSSQWGKINTNWVSFIFRFYPKRKKGPSCFLLAQTNFSSFAEIKKMSCSTLYRVIKSIFYSPADFGNIILLIYSSRSSKLKGLAVLHTFRFAANGSAKPKIIVGFIIVEVLVTLRASKNENRGHQLRCLQTWLKLIQSFFKSYINTSPQINLVLMASHVSQSQQVQRFQALLRWLQVNLQKH